MDMYWLWLVDRDTVLSALTQVGGESGLYWCSAQVVYLETGCGGIQGKTKGTELSCGIMQGYADYCWLLDADLFVQGRQFQ